MIWLYVQFWAQIRSSNVLEVQSLKFEMFEVLMFDPPLVAIETAVSCRTGQSGQS